MLYSKQWKRKSRQVWC